MERGSTSVKGINDSNGGADEFKLRASYWAGRLPVQLLGWVVVACLFAAADMVVEHQWPGIAAWAVFFGVALVARVEAAHREVVTLLERQNALLERRTVRVDSGEDR